MGKPYELSGEATPNVVENIDRMFRELYDATANATHAMLSATHSDSTPSAVARGSIITGQGSAPVTWTQLVLGTGNKVLRSDGVDASWAAVVLTSDVSGILPVANGGTAIASYAIGDLLYASASGVLSKLADVAAGSYLRSGGVTTAPLWSTLILPNAAAQGDIVYANATNTLTTLAKSTTASRYISNQGGTNNPLWDFVNLANGVTNTLPAGNGGTGQFTFAVGDILYASTTSVLSRLADVATGNALISGGVGVAPAWGKVALTTHVSGVLPEANGGTNQSTYASGDIIYASAANTLSKLAKSTDGFVLTLASGLPSWAASAGGGAAVTEQTTTSTGTQNDFSLSARNTYLRCNNATALTLNGFSISGGAPQAGDVVTLENIGTSTVRVAHQAAASTAAYRTICLSTTGQIIGAGGRIVCVYDDTTDRWRTQVIDPGTPITPAFAAGDFTASGAMTWTVDAADVANYSYQQRGKVVFYMITLNSTSVGGVADQELRISLQGFTPSKNVVAQIGYTSDNGTVKAGLFFPQTTSPAIKCYVDNTLATNWAAAVNSTTIRGSLFLEVD